MNSDRIECFLCGLDITDKVKVLSYFNFPSQAWDNAQKDWVKNFKELFNGCMCVDCANKDMAINQLKTNQKKEIDNAVLEAIKPLETELSNITNKLSKFIHLFGRLYLKV